MDKSMFDDLIEGENINNKDETLEEESMENVSFEDIAGTFDSTLNQLQEESFFEELDREDDKEIIEESIKDEYKEKEDSRITFNSLNEFNDTLTPELVDQLIEEAAEELGGIMLDQEFLKEEYGIIDRTIETIEGDKLIERMIKMEGLDIDPEVLEEAGVNQVRLSHEAKRKRIESQSAMILAREANDIMYTRYVKFNRLRKKLKEQIKTKYAAQARVRAREVMERSNRKK